ncbi:MAG: hypothetical protein H3C35_04355 [Bacteroidetes bacterium]|nr:hypothetical protein [Bacteroidota bacterium]
MAKTQDFAKKAEKATKDSVAKCPKCGQPKVSMMFVNSVKTDGGSYRFNRSMASVCKCNEKEIYG